MVSAVDRLSAELTEKYVQYLETFLVDLWSEAGAIEFRCGFTLRSDHLLRSFTLKVPAIYGNTDQARDMVIGLIFEQIEDTIDEAMAEDRTASN